MTLCIIKKRSLDNILNITNGFHPKTQFIYEEEVDNMIAFLDLLLITLRKSSTYCARILDALTKRVPNNLARVGGMDPRGLSW